MSVPFEEIELILQRARRGESVTSGVNALPPLLRSEVRAMLAGQEELGYAVGPEWAQPAGAESYGPFLVLGVLARGGQATVYRARWQAGGAAPAPAEAEVALKVLDRPLVSGEARARFEREIEIASRLRHPNICPILAFGMRPSPWIAMPLFRRGTLADNQTPGSRDAERSEGARAWRTAVTWVGQMARALHVAHESGIVHRDVKPGNIALSDDGEPVVLDFGLALMETPNGPAITGSHQTLGTPEYMAPEQIEPGTRTTGREADVWALGVVLFELLFGRRPFAATNREGLYRAILHERPSLPGTAPVDLPRDLWRVVEGCLEKDLHRRYRSGAALADDLDRVLGGQRVLVGPIPWWVHLGRFITRHPRLTGVAGALGLAWITAFCTALWFLDQAKDDQAFAVGAQRSERAARLREEGLRWLVEARRDLPNDPGSARARVLLAADRVEHPEVASTALEVLFAGREERRFQVPGPVRWSVASSSGARVAVATDKDICLVDAWSGTVAHKLAVAVTALALSPDGERIAWGDASGAVSCASWADPTIRTDRPGAGRPISALGFSSDGEWLLSGSDDGHIGQWEGEGLRPVPTSVRWSVGVVRLSMFRGPRGEWLTAWLLDDGTLRVTDASGQDRFVIQSDVPIRSFDVSSPAQRLAALQDDGAVRLFETSKGREVDAFPPLRRRIRGVRFDARGKSMALASADGTIIVRGIGGGFVEDVLRGSDGVAHCHWVGPSTGRLFSVAPSGDARLWRVGAPVGAALIAPEQPATDAVMDGAGRVLVRTSAGLSAWSGESGEFLQWVGGGAPGRGFRQQIGRGLPLVLWDGHGGLSVYEDPLQDAGHTVRWTATGRVAHLDAVMSGDGRWLVVTSSAGRGALFDLPGTRSWNFDGVVSSDRRWPVGGFLDQNRTVAAVSPNPAAPAVLFWSVGRQEPPVTVPLVGSVRSLLTCENGHRVLVLDDRGRVHLLDARGVIGSYAGAGDEGFDRGVLAATGDRCAWVTEGGRVALFSVHPDRLGEPRLLPDQGSVTALGFSRDGRVLAVGTDQGVVGLYSSGDAAHLLDHRGHRVAVTGVSFSDDGSTVVSTDDSGRVFVWPVDPVGRIRRWAEDCGVPK